MHKVWAVIRREFVERVRTRVFVLSTLLFPVFMAAMIVIPGFLMSRSTGTKRVVLVDATTDSTGIRMAGALGAVRVRGDTARAKFTVERVPAVGRVTEVRDSLLPITGLSRKTADSWDGILVVSDSTVIGGKASYYGANVASFDDMRELEQTLRPIVVTRRLAGLGVDIDTVMKSMRGIDLVTSKVANGKLTGESGAATFALAYAMGFILYFSLLIFGNQVMNSIVEEKNNRIVEILASSLRPFEMMLGKVLGVGLVALLQITIWAGAATLFSKYQSQILGSIGAAGTAGQMPFTFPAMSFDLLLVFLTFFALGFLLYAAAYAAVGAMCNTVQEAGQAQFPVMMFVLVGFFSVFALIRDPNGTAAQVLTFVPMLTPFVVPMRYSISPLNPVELLLSIAATLAGLMAIVWLAGRIYRIGILSYGKKATMRDMLRWIRTA